MIGRVFHIQRFSLHDGPGIRTTVFMMGCNMNCLWCHNPEGKCYDMRLQYDKKNCIGCGACVAACERQVHTVTQEGHTVSFENCGGCGKCMEACPSGALSFSGKEYTPQQLAEQIARDRNFFKEIGGVTFSGGEPLLQAEFVSQTAKLCKEQGVPTVTIDTAGLVSREAFEKVLPVTDHFLFDVKAISEEVHICGTGVSNSGILENLRWLDTQGKNIYIRVPVIPGINDDPEEIRKIGDFVHTLTSIRELRLLPYHTFGREKYETLGDQTPVCFSVTEEETLNKLNRIARCF